MDLDDQDDDAINGYFDQISSSSQSQSSQRAHGAPIPRPAPIPQSNVANRRNRKVGVVDGKVKAPAAEPGFGNAPANITKTRKALFDALGAIKSHKKDAMMTKKDCFNNSLLDNFAEAAPFLDLEETGDFIKYSAMVYGLRVDTTYNDAMSTNTQLQPANAKGEELSKKSKAEMKLQASTATQSLNLQKLNEMTLDEAEEERQNSTSPDVFLDMPEPESSSQADGGVATAPAAAATVGGGGGEAGGEEDDGGMGGGGGLGSDDDEGDARREEELTEEQKEKRSDEKAFDTSVLTHDGMSIKDIIANEVKRRARNLDRKCDENPMLMDDERKYRMTPASILTNEYYQIATARYKDLNASGMLTYNAKVTHNGRMTLMHKRMDGWSDHEASNVTPPTRAFRKALSGLVENALQPNPVALKHDLFDECDMPVVNKLSTGSDLQKIEKATKERIMNNDELTLLDQDGRAHPDDFDFDEEAPPSTRRPDDVTGGGEDGGMPDPHSSASSMNPSTPAAETEASEASTRNTPKDADKEEEDRIKEDLGMLSQGEEVTTGAPRKKKLRKAAAFASILCEDEIPGGPVLVVDYLASKFQQILSDKLAKESDDKNKDKNDDENFDENAKKEKAKAIKEWRYGAFAEELEADLQQINDESHFVANASFDLDQMHLDKMWTSEYYKKAFTEREVREIKDRIKPLVSNDEFTKICGYLRAGVKYEFFGEKDHWSNPAIPPDEEAHLDNDEDEPLVRPLADERETKRFEKTRLSQGSGGVGVFSDAEEDTNAGAADAADDRITVAATSIEFDNQNQMNDDGFDDMGDGGFMSDGNEDTHEEEAGSSRRTDFTAGDEGRPDEMLGDVNMADAILPSMEVRATGKTDDSHWKGGENAEVAAKVKKERKKKPRDEEESQVNRYFAITDDMLDKIKVRRRFAQADRNFDLMRETEQLLMPVQINVQPQLDYDTSLFYKPFLLPDTLHAKYAYRREHEPSEPTEEDDTINLEPQGHLAHYTSMLESSMSEGRDAEDVFLSFMRTFRHFPEVATVKEMDLEERVHRGELAADEAAAEMNSQDSADVGAMGFDDHGDNDFGGGGFDDDEGGAQPGDSAANLLSQKTERRSSIARSLAQGSTHGYAMRVGEREDDGNDEADAVATVGDREYQLRLIKLDTVAMKTALSDVLTNPLMESEKLDETLGLFHRAFPSQKMDDDRRKKKGRTPMQTLNEDEEAEFEERERRRDDLDETRDDSQPEVDIEATMMEVPDAMDVTRALFAPPKEKAEPNKTVMFGGAANSSQSRANTSDHIKLSSDGHHTLKSTFTCLPARMPLRATSDVTVASTIAMILHLANENNLILEQPGQEDGIHSVDVNTTTYGEWMNDFKVQEDPEDQSGGKNLKKTIKRMSQAMEVLTSLSADDDASDAEKRQKASEKLLREMAEKQQQERERVAAAAARRRATAGTSSAAEDVDDEDEEIDVEGLSGEEEPVVPAPSPAFKVPAGRAGAASSAASAAVKRGTPRKTGNDESEAGPSSSKRTRRTSDGAANTTVQLDDTITIE